MILFIHYGSPPPFLIAAIFQARASDPDCAITLFTDQPKSTLSFLSQSVFIEEIAANSPRLTRFRLGYRHSGRNREEYERRCFERWLVIADWVEATSHSGPLMYLDSDALLLMPFSEISNSIKADTTVTNKVGPQFTFFRSSDAVLNLSDFLLAAYETETNFRALEEFVRRFPGKGVPHVSDMALFGLFGETHELEDIGDPARRTFMFDENIGESQGLRLGLLGKRITRRAGRRYFHTIGGDLVLAGGLHLQGGNKTLWPLHVAPAVHQKFLVARPGAYFVSLIAAFQKTITVVGLRLTRKIRRAKTPALSR